MLPSNSKKKSIPASLRARKPIPESLKARKPTQRSTPKFVRGGGAGPGEGVLASQVVEAMKFLFGDSSEITTNAGGVTRKVKIAESGNPIGSIIGAAGRKLASDAAKGIAKKEAKNTASLTKPRTAKPAKPAAKLSKAEARDMELADIKRLMMPDPRPARAAAKFSADDGIRQAMRGKSGKALTTGPKPVRSGFKTAAAFKTALKKWESKLEANRAAVRGGGDSTPVAPKATPAVKKPAVKKDPAPVAKKDPVTPKKPAVKKPQAKKPTTSTALVVRPGSAVATRPGAPTASTASKDVVKERGVPTFSYARPTTAAGRAKLAIEGPKAQAKRPAAIAAGRSQLAIEGPKKAATAAKGGMSKKKKALIGAAGATGLLFGAGEVLRRSDSESSKADGAEGIKRQVLTDKYGRQIGRAEYNRREKYRASIAGKTPKQVEKMRKAEQKRRLEFRRSDGKKQFGALASKKSKNLNVPVGTKVRKIRQGPVSPQNIRDRERFK